MVSDIDSVTRLEQFDKRLETLKGLPELEQGIKLPAALAVATEVLNHLQRHASNIVIPDADGNAINWIFREKSFDSSPEAVALFDRRALTKLQEYHRHFLRRVSGASPNGQAFSAEGIRLIYSFIYNTLDPQDRKAQTCRFGIEAMFKALQLDKPMNENEVLENAAQLLAMGGQGRQP